MKLPAWKSSLQHDILIAINHEWDYVRIAVEWYNEYHLTRPGLVLEDSQVLLAQDKFRNFLKRDPSCCNQTIIFSFIPDDVHI